MLYPTQPNSPSCSMVGWCRLCPLFSSSEDILAVGPYTIQDKGVLNNLKMNMEELRKQDLFNMRGHSGKLEY